jgi:hypothetical protein
VVGEGLAAVERQEGLEDVHACVGVAVAYNLLHLPILGRGLCPRIVAAVAGAEMVVCRAGSRPLPLQSWQRAAAALPHHHSMTLRAERLHQHHEHPIRRIQAATEFIMR